MIIGKKRELVVVALWLGAILTPTPGQAQDVPPLDLDKTVSDAASKLPTPAGSTDATCSVTCGREICSSPEGRSCTCKCTLLWECECWSSGGFLELLQLQ